MTQSQSLLDIHVHMTSAPAERHKSFAFAVPDGSTKVILRVAFDSPVLAQIPMTLFDPQGYRGTRVYPFARGEIREHLWVAPNDASQGGIPGNLVPGEWRVQLFARKLDQAVDLHLEVLAECGPVPDNVHIRSSGNRILNPEPGWYKGELHCHSTESTGEEPIETVIRSAGDADLDFLSLTDGFTISQWYKMRQFENGRVALLNGCELVGFFGHANVHGAHEWVDPFVDREDWGMNQAADAVHAQGGLFCVNHPLNARLGWRYHDFDWSKSDLIEIYSIPERINNNLQPLLWDRLLSLGHRIVGVGSTDSHNPFKPIWQLGKLLTWVYAPNLSEQGIIAGLRSGQVFVSRGPEIRFSAVNTQGAQVVMGGTLPLDQSRVTFEIKIKTDEPLNIFVLKNGFIFEMLAVEAGSGEWQTLNFSDTATQNAYYRFECHAIRMDANVNPAYFVWRDYETLRVFSNPIWIADPIIVR